MYMTVNGIKTTGQTSLCIQPEQTLSVRLRLAAVGSNSHAITVSCCSRCVLDTNCDHDQPQLSLTW